MITEQNLIFLISQPRSGSTLLQRLLGNHSEIFTRSEPWIMLYSLYSLKQKKISAQFDINVWEKAFNDFIENLPDRGKEEYIKELKNMHLNLYSKYLLKSKKNYFLDKTPRYYLIMEELKTIFPHSKKILLIRNPLAVMSSILNTWLKDDYKTLYKFQDDLFLCIKESIKILQENKKENSFHILRYENFVSNPDFELNSLCQYLNLDNEKELLDFESNKIDTWIYGDPVNAKNKDFIDNDYDKWLSNIKSGQEWRLLYDYLQTIGKKDFELLGYDFKYFELALLQNIPNGNIINTIETTLSLEEHLLQRISIDNKMSVIENKIRSIELNIFDTKSILRNRPKKVDFSKKFNLFFDSIMEIKEDNEQLPYIIYGHGKIGKTINSMIPEKILAFVDRNSTNTSINIEKGQVYSPQNLKNMNFSKIIISVVGEEDRIIEFLTKNLNIDRNKILTLNIKDDNNE